MSEKEEGFPFLRRIDEVGRLVIPKDLRRVLGWDSQTPVVLQIEKGRLVVQRYENTRNDE